MPDADLFEERYPTLYAYSAAMSAPAREVIGREHEIQQVQAALARPEVSNVILLGDPGIGKTAVIQAVAQADAARDYREVDLARMISGLANPDEMAALLKTLFDEAERYASQEGRELALFIDEFHQVVQLSAAAVEALKPALAASGTRGLRVIAATTYDEFHQHIRSNQPLVERLQRINLAPPDRQTTVRILRGMAARYGVADQFFDDSMFETIHELTERYMPASVQPRKSILVLDSMVGWHRHTGRPMDMRLLADVLQESAGVNVMFQVDPLTIKEELDKKVFSQDFATRVVAKRLQLCVADLHDKGRPVSSFLLTGATGVGKLCTDDTPVPVYTEDGSVPWKRHGDLQPGDLVFTRRGTPTTVRAVFPNLPMKIYRVTLWDGRTIDVGGEHLWTVYTSSQRMKKHAGKVISPRVISTVEMLERGVVRTYAGDTRAHLKYFIPAAEPVQWPERVFEIPPYVLGVLIGNGCLTQKPLTVSGSDPEPIFEVAAAFGAAADEASAGNYNWVFSTGESWGKHKKRIQTADALRSVPELVGVYSGERRIPAAYLVGSVEQRWGLVRGLFDTDGTIDAQTGRFNVSYSTFSKGLANDVRRLLFSLGVSSSVTTGIREKRSGRVLVEYSVHVKVGNEAKAQFFSLPRKREIAEQAVAATAHRTRVKKFDMVGITSIEELPEQQSASCIYVDDPEHLYQAGDFIVTHNTELTKQLARLLFGDDQRHLVRMDMSEFALPESVELFRSELTQRVWSMGHCVLLLDEVEKAAPTVTRVLLQVLDDGRLSDDNGRQVSFLNCYIVMTTNAGSEIYRTIEQYSPDDDGSGREMAGRMREIRRSISTTQGEGGFPPELLGRIDAIVPFQPLSMGTRRKITQNRLAALRDEVQRKHGVRVSFDKRVLDFLVEDRADSDSDAGGARAALALLADEVTAKIAAFVNAHPGRPRIRVQVDGVLRSEDKNLLDSDATIEIVALR